MCGKVSATRPLQERLVPYAALPSSNRLHLIRAVFFSSRSRHTRYWRDWSSDVCSSDLGDHVSDLLRCGQALVSTVPVKRLATSEEIAHVIAFVASDNASYMTGSSIPVDGGMIAG